MLCKAIGPTTPCLSLNGTSHGWIFAWVVGPASWRLCRRFLDSVSYPKSLERSRAVFTSGIALNAIGLLCFGNGLLWAGWCFRFLGSLLLSVGSQAALQVLFFRSQSPPAKWGRGNYRAALTSWLSLTGYCSDPVMMNSIFAYFFFRPKHAIYLPGAIIFTFASFLTVVSLFFCLCGYFLLDW